MGTKKLAAASPAPILRTYADIIQFLLAESNQTAYALAKLSGLTVPAVYDLTAGRRIPQAETLRKILAAFGKPWGWLDENFRPDGEVKPVGRIVRDSVKGKRKPAAQKSRSNQVRKPKGK